eukprot:scaffold117502_cov20-Tisochrysis_lutea.AAC.2
MHKQAQAGHKGTPRAYLERISNLLLHLMHRMMQAGTSKTYRHDQGEPSAHQRSAPAAGARHRAGGTAEPHAPSPRMQITRARSHPGKPAIGMHGVEEGGGRSRWYGPIAGALSPRSKKAASNMDIVEMVEARAQGYSMQSWITF